MLKKVLLLTNSNKVGLDIYLPYEKLISLTHPQFLIQIKSAKTKAFDGSNQRLFFANSKFFIQIVIYVFGKVCRTIFVTLTRKIFCASRSGLIKTIKRIS